MENKCFSLSPPVFSLRLRILKSCEFVQITKLKATMHAMSNPQGLYFVEGVQVLFVGLFDIR
jgi:hypothetical protein